VVTARRNGAGKGTSSSSFGSSGRENHDSSRFYSSRMYASLPKEETGPFSENPLPLGVLDTIMCRSSEAMADLPDSSVHLMVTSPPYNAGKDYDEDLTLAEYLAFLRNVWREVHRVLVPGGRACINVANLGRRPYIPLNASISAEMIDIGFLMRGEIIWQKGSSSGTSTAWGSWMSPSNPTLRDTHEYIQVFSKGGFGRKAASDRPPTITKEQFLEYTKSVWTFTSESARRVGHPAPFPIELPYRLIQLYTFEDEIVLDPFMGSGQTAIAALQSKRHFVGYEIDPDYTQLAQKRIIESSSKPFAPRLFELAEK
jgi:modification methylase